MLQISSKPNLETQTAVIGMMTTSLELMKAAMEHERQIIIDGAEGERKKGNQQLARDGMKMIGRLADSVIKAKLKGKSKGKDSAGEKGSTRGPPTPTEQLHMMRDALFEVATDADWGLIRKVAGDTITDRLLAIKTGAIDLGHLGQTIEQMTTNLSMAQLAELLQGLSEKTQDIIMSLGDAYEAAKAQQEQEQDETNE